MLIKSPAIIAFVFLICAGCATSQANKKPGFFTYPADLNGDGRFKIVEVEDKSVSATGEGLEVVVYEKSKEKEKIDSISLPGKYIKMDLLELNPSDTRQQIAIYSKVEDNATNLVIYKLQNNILTKMFDATSEYGVELDSLGVITRVKIGKIKAHQQANSPNCVNEWESWVWTGDKFVKE